MKILIAVIFFILFYSTEVQAQIKVAAGESHSMAIHENGSLWVWGDNAFGQIGNGKTTVYSAILSGTPQNTIFENNDVYRPVKIMDNIVDIAAGDGFSLAINEHGELFAWGLNDLGQLGDGTRINRATPTKIMDNVASVDASGSTSLAVTTDGKLYTWGFDGRGGNSRTNAVDTPTYITNNVKTAQALSFAVIFLRNDSRLYSFGKPSLLGINSTELNKYIDSPAFIMENVRFIAANGQNSLAITTDDRLYSFGPNARSLAGIRSNEFWINTPHFVADDVKSAFSSFMYLKNDNSLWIWGAIESTTAKRATNDGQGMNTGGAMGDTIIQYGNVPVKIMDNVLTACSGRGFHYLVVDRDKNLFAWGNNQFGQLGTGKANIYELEKKYGYDSYDEWTNTAIAENNNKANPVLIGNVAAYRAVNINFSHETTEHAFSCTRSRINTLISSERFTIYE